MFVQKYIVTILLLSVVIINCLKINNKKRNLSLGDLSYSYAATDIGTTNGTHIKTITVIRNIGINRKNLNSTVNNNNNKEQTGKGNSLPDQITEELLNYQKFITNLTFFTDVTTAKAILKQPTAPPTTAATKLDKEMISPASINDKNMENKELKIDDIAIDSNSPINADTIKQIRNINIRFNDKFDDYSMHNIKHLNNPLKNKEVNVKHQQYNVYVAPKLRKDNRYNK